MEDKENEEYKKRIRDLVERLEKDKDTPEDYQLLLEALEKLKEAIIPNIHDKYRNKNVISGCVFLIREYYDLRKDPNSPFEKEQFQANIDLAYKYIYEELKKQIFEPNRPKYARISDKEFKDIFMTIERMKMVLGTENVDQFYKTYKIKELVSLSPHLFAKPENFKKVLYVFLIVITIFTIFRIIFTRF